MEVNCMEKGREYKISVALALSLLIVLMAGPAWPQVGQPAIDTFRLSHIKSFDPFAIVKGDESEGLSVDILREALGKVGLKVVFVGQDQEKEQESLAQGQVDGLTFFAINPERKKTYDFSDPYLMTGGALFVKSPNPPCSDLKELEGKIVATPLKGPLAGYIKEKYPKITVYTDVKDYQATLQAVLDEKAYAAALNTQVGAVLAQKLYPGKFSLPDKGYQEIPIGVAVMKGKQEVLLKKFNEGLKAILSDGTYDSIIAKWGVPAATKPRPR
jgi:ABC-type amino acid transport substrate-binding protein